MLQYFGDNLEDDAVGVLGFGVGGLGLNLENHVVELEEGERVLPGETELDRFK